MNAAKQRKIKRQSEEQVLRSPQNLDRQALAGTWSNTNNATLGIVRLVLRANEDGLVVRVVGACDPAPCDWGTANADVFATELGSGEGSAFNAFYDFGFMETRLQAHIGQGVLVVAKFDRFKDDSGRANYFSKEFFFRESN